jgi:hypothetical protein
MATIEVDEAVKRSVSFAARMADVTEGELSDLRAIRRVGHRPRQALRLARRLQPPPRPLRRPPRQAQEHVSRARPDRKPSPPVYRAASPIR